MKTLSEIREVLEKRGYEAHVFTRAEAVEFVTAAAKKADNVGWGGSETVKELGLRDAVAALGKEIRDHRADCDLFLLSANALLEDGRIVNIDGTGNRIAASIWGPKQVIYLIGRNKIVAGGVDDAVLRIRRETCPKNAVRLARKTPCAVNACPALSGNPAGCASPDRMCKVTAVFDCPPSRTSTAVILIDEPLGY